MAKLHEMHFEWFLHPPYSLDVASNDYYLFADLKRILQGKRFCSNKKVMAENEAYFEAKDKYKYINLRIIPYQIYMSWHI